MAIAAYYRFNGNSNDLSGNAYNGSDTNITYSLGYAIFNGSSSRINYSAKFMPVGAKTISARIYVATGAPDGYLYDDDNSQTQYGNNIVIRIASGLYFTLWRYSHSLGYQFVSNILLTLDKWNDLWITWDGTTGTNAVKLYLNGSLAVQGTSFGVEDRASAVNPIMGCTNALNVFFGGNVDTFWCANTNLGVAAMKNELSKNKGFF